LQSEADHPQSIDRSHARDEALDVVLDEITSAPTRDEALMRRRYYSLCRNRLSKQNNRRAVDRRCSRSAHRRGGSEFGGMVLTVPTRSSFDQAAFAQLTALIRTLLPEEDFALLVEIADGHTLAEMASERRVTVASLKSRAFRIREKVRSSSIAATLYHGLRRC
jgi:DNA-directed RNA polymerase specialized sigma24 family protein